MCETGLVFNCWRTDELFEISVKFPKGSDLTEVINGYKRFGFPNCGSKIEGRRISFIALNIMLITWILKGGTPLLCRGYLFTDVMCTSDSLDSCMAPGFWQTLISIAEVRKKYCSEIESCKSKPMDQKFQLFCVATRHSRWSSDYRKKPWPYVL